MTLDELSSLVEYTQRAKRQRCTWQTPRCIGRAVYDDGRGCTCEGGMRDHAPRDVVEAWGRGYKTVGHYLAARERDDLLPFDRPMRDRRRSAAAIPLRGSR